MIYVFIFFSVLLTWLQSNRDSLFHQLCTIANSQTSEAEETLSPYMTNKLKMVKQIIIDGNILL